MAYREVTRVDIQEIIRRWQAGEGYRRIAAGTSLSRNTVRKYLSAAKAEDITQDGSVPTDDQLSHLAVIGQSGRAGPRPGWRKLWMCPRARCSVSSGASPSMGWTGRSETGPSPTGTASWMTGAKPISSPWPAAQLPRATSTGICACWRTGWWSWEWSSPCPTRRCACT